MVLLPGLRVQQFTVDRPVVDGSGRPAGFTPVGDGAGAVNLAPVIPGTVAGGYGFTVDATLGTQSGVAAVVEPYDRVSVAGETFRVVGIRRTRVHTRLMMTRTNMGHRPAAPGPYGGGGDAA